MNMGVSNIGQTDNGIVNVCSGSSQISSDGSTTCNTRPLSSNQCP
jgi:hypothetical protein